MKKYKNIIFLSLILMVSLFLLCPAVAEATEACDISKMQEQYTKHCISCPTVATIISVFLEVGADSYPLMRSAANTILGIMSVLWIALYFLKKLSAFTPIELPEMMQELSIFFFKILVAAVGINGGISVILYYTLDPIISFGSDFGIGILRLTADIPVSSAEDLMDMINKIRDMEVLHA